MTTPRSHRRPRLTALTLATVLLGGAAAACSPDDDPPANSESSDSAAPGGTLTEERLREQVQQVLADGGYQGITVRVRDGKDVITAEAGTARRGSDQPVPENPNFRAASTTKPFVATVVLQLVAEGKLSLDDTVEKHLPGTVRGNGNDGSQITIRHLLRHTSGLADYFSSISNDAETFEKLRNKHWDAKQLVAMGMEHKPSFPPADPDDPKPKWEYSNTNYILAGLVIEKVTGNTWVAEVTRRIIEPLGLEHTYDPGDDTELPEPFMRTYQQWPDSEKWVDTTFRNLTQGGAAGSLVSTTEDLDTFFTALVDGTLLEPAEWKEMSSTVPTDENFRTAFPGAEYGLGVMSQPTSCGGEMWAHGGDLEGGSVRNGTTADARRSIMISTSGSGSDMNEALAAEKAVQKLINSALCPTEE